LKEKGPVDPSEEKKSDGSRRYSNHDHSEKMWNGARMGGKVGGFRQTEMERFETETVLKESLNRIQKSPKVENPSSKA